MNKQQLVLTNVLATTLATSLIGCVEQTYVKREYHVGVKLADTPEALRCKTGCIALVSQSRQMCSEIGDTLILEDGFASKFGCYGLVSDCFLSCPGSTLDKTDTPKVVITTKSIDGYCDSHYKCNEGYECIGHVIDAPEGRCMGQCVMTTVESIR